MLALLLRPCSAHPSPSVRTVRTIDLATLTKQQVRHLYRGQGSSFFARNDAERGI